MPVANNIIASAKVLAQASLNTVGGINHYTAPANTAAVPSPFATAIIREIIVFNNTAAIAYVNVTIGSVYFMSSIPIAPFDAKIMTGLSHAMNATSSIQASSPQGSGVWLIVSGQEFMASGTGISSNAIASFKKLSESPNLSTTVNNVAYTSPATNTNVPASFSTAYIKEIIITNKTVTAATIWLTINGGFPIIYNTSIPANDTKVISGLNTMMSANSQIQAWSGTASALDLMISGVEVQ